MNISMYINYADLWGGYVELQNMLPYIIIITIIIKKVKISLLQAVEAPRVARGLGCHVT
jgi:hypothetical protein